MLVPPGCAITLASSSLPGIVARATAAPHPRVRPKAVQIADRWHLFGNASASFLDQNMHATRRRLDESSKPAGRIRKIPSARKIARLMTIERDRVPRDHVSIMAKIAHDVAPLLEARGLVDRFHEIIRQHKAVDLDPWIAAAIKSTQLVRQGHHRRSRRRSSRDHPTMVERSDRRSNHKAQAGEASYTGVQNSICSRHALSAPRKQLH